VKEEVKEEEEKMGEEIKIEPEEEEAARALEEPKQEEVIEIVQPIKKVEIKEDKEEKNEEIEMKQEVEEKVVQYRDDIEVTLTHEPQTQVHAMLPNLLEESEMTQREEHEEHQQNVGLDFTRQHGFNTIEDSEAPQSNKPTPPVGFSQNTLNVVKKVLSNKSSPGELPKSKGDFKAPLPPPAQSSVQVSNDNNFLNQIFTEEESAMGQDIEDDEEVQALIRETRAERRNETAPNSPPEVTQMEAFDVSDEEQALSILEPSPERRNQ